MNTLAEMVKDGYAITTLAGRKVVYKYFAEYDETFIHPANENTYKWNLGNYFLKWVAKVEDTVGEVYTADPTVIVITGDSVNKKLAEAAAARYAKMFDV